MAFPSRKDRQFAQIVARMGYGNPFLPERIESEKAALGDEFTAIDIVWNQRPDLLGDHPNIIRINERVEDLAARWRDSLAQGGAVDDEDLELYEDLVHYMLYHRYREPFDGLIGADRKGKGKSKPRHVAFYKKFSETAAHFFEIPNCRFRPQYKTPHLFAGFYQIRRAFHHIFNYIVGESMSTARLRAAIWQSIFTHDMRRYWRALWERMADITTLITGPSGTGKELVARAVGLSRYIAFDPESGAFIEDYAGSFYAFNLSALSPTLIESELFGHRRGSFTGAFEDRQGWLEVCTPLGTVFLDEIGELDARIQVKLLRVLQTRTFQRLGETANRPFRGKIIAATNRNLAEEMRAKRFREDLYYRLCSDIIVTPSLGEQLRDSSKAMTYLIYFISRNMAGEEEARRLADEVEAWIDEHLGRDYPWPGNVRELEQCVRNIMIHKSYTPLAAQSRGAREELGRQVGAGALTADELLRHYCTLIYAQTGSYQETARRLKLDHRTVKSKIDPELLDEYL